MRTRLSKLLPVAPIAFGTTGVAGMTSMAMRDSSKSAVFFLVTVRVMIFFSFIPSFRLDIPEDLEKYLAKIVWNSSQQHARLRIVRPAPSTKRQDPILTPYMDSLASRFADKGFGGSLACWQ